MDGGERIQKGGAKKKGKIIKGPDDDTAYVEEGVRTRITGSGSTVFSIAWMHYYAWNPSPTIAVSNHRHAWTDLRSIIVAKGEKGFFSKNHSHYVCHFAPTFDAFYSPYTPLFLCIDACVCIFSTTLPRNVSKLFALRWKESRGREGHRVGVAKRQLLLGRLRRRRRRRRGEKSCRGVVFMLVVFTGRE